MGNNLLLQPKDRELQQLRTQQDKERQKSESLAKVAQLEQSMDKYNAAFLERHDVSALIEAVNRMGEESGVNLSSVIPLPAEAVEKLYVKLPIQVELHCSYHQLGRFLSRIESASMFIKVEALSIENRVNYATRAPEMLISVSLSAFYPAAK